MPSMMLIIIFLLKISFCVHVEYPQITVKLFQDIQIYKYSASSCYLPDVSKGLVPYVWELHVGRAKGFIVAKGDDTKLPTPEKQTIQFIISSF
jgi:hypothetical protein